MDSEDQPTSRRATSSQSRPPARTLSMPFHLRWSLIIREALGCRRGDRASSYHNLFARRRDALTFMEYVIANAGA